MIGWIVLLAVAVGWLALGLASYVLFHPFVDTLKQKVVLNAIAVPGLIAFFLPALRNEQPLMIPVYFVSCAIFFAVAAVVFHFAEQWLYPSDVKVRA